MDLSLAVTRQSDGVVRIEPRGEVDVGNAFRIREVVDAVLAERRPARIVLDLSAVTLIDSLGIGALVSCYHAAAASGVPLVAVDPQPVVYRSLWVAGLAGLFGLLSATTDPSAPVPTTGAPGRR